MKKSNHTDGRVKKVARVAVGIALAFIFSYVESMIPMPVPIPGIKPGLANIVILITLYTADEGTAYLISVLRCLLVALVFTSLSGFFYSIAGALLSLSIMAVLKRFSPLSVISISAIGGIAHNVGQFIVAACVVGISPMLRYLPVLYFAGLITGVFIGCLTRIFLAHYKDTLI